MEITDDHLYHHGRSTVLSKACPMRGSFDYYDVLVSLNGVAEVP